MRLQQLGHQKTLTKFEKYVWIAIAMICALASLTLTIFYTVQELFIETFCVGCAAAIAITIVITAVKMPVVRVDVKDE